MSALSAIYYPFSRCIDVAALKQLLLVFDSVTFLDPVTDDEWRAYLMKEMIEDEDRRFAKYQDIHRSLDELREDHAIRIVTPDCCTDHHRLVTASALSDLRDTDWLRVASKPASFDMPHRRYAADGSATWQVFKPKLPDEFLAVLSSSEELRRHLVHVGDDYTSYTLTYEAGSAIAISLYLSAAEKLALAPVTDSVMHHQLLLHKAMRMHYGEALGTTTAPFPPKAVSQIAHQTAFSLVQGLLPRHVLARMSLRDVLKFRKETAPYRDKFIVDLSSRFELIKSEIQPEKLSFTQAELRSTIIFELKQFQDAVSAARDKIWPNMASSFNKSLATGGAAAVGFNLIGGPGQVLAASIAAASLTFLNGMLDIRAEVKKAERSASPSIAYLSKVASIK
ncbi:MAG: hypothetical protein Q8S96_02260 [Hydrogenophaga sp.]|uniref:hypothetical protein n=1 Tax=Hydrogenophaga sp. TaxID=1904254 RepID=UPI0027269CCB|nr:hypothetical protein [Hydrogenophaga sp.]MDO9480778.1 hypothetical protein [Hydrogenophaga sp.]MDP3343265.1 hypothetical protein [Hydrogenophaga sp.]MDP3808339.1 hypothetical protein [Hydrogenophaga sp.]